MADGGSYLETFVSLARSTDGGRVTADIVLNALKHKHIFFYGELLDVAAVQKLKGTPEFELLEIFAFGTYQAWLARRNALPPLTDVHLTKLRQLTLLHLAATSAGSSLQYSQCQEACGIGSVREIEDLVISSVYANLMRARLDQRNSRIIVDWAAGRDVPLESLGAFVLKLDAWCNNADAVLSRLKEANQYAEAQKADKQGHHQAVKLQAEQLKIQIASESESAFQGKGGAAPPPSLQGGTTSTSAKHHQTRSGPARR